ncbi:MAG: SAM-dependent methyltransferase [Flammeovirgaceae bacterium]|nr:SAM-dependent methyltransferase [Flammeovirgaceae bacterium]
MNQSGTVYLIPTVIAENTEARVIPQQVRDALIEIDYFLVENVRTARRFLSSLKIYSTIESLQFEELNKDTSVQQIAEYFKDVLGGRNIGIVSESGCPGVADPGALAVAYAHKNYIKVIPLAGPSSLLMALMASGLNGQRFAFHGYLPVEAKESATAIKNYEKESRTKNQTQIFIETPYRNNSLWSNLVRTLSTTTRLCIALDVTGKSEFIQTKTVEQWKKITLDLPKAPAVFLFLSD